MSDVFDSDDESSDHTEDEHHAIFVAQDIHTLGAFRILSRITSLEQLASMQQAGQAPRMDQDDAQEQILGQSDGALPPF